MSSIRRLVSPRLPTALADRESVDLHGQDLFLLPMEHVYILPIKLDIAMFEQALSKTLQLYPHAAGKLRCNDGRWSIELTNTPVPVDIEYMPDATSDAFLSDDSVIQDDISPFLSHEPISLLPVDDGNTNLLRLKLIFFEHETSLGFRCHHTLGDATLAFRFMHTFSQFYQGLPLVHAPPTFEKYHFPTPTASMTAELGPLLANLRLTWPLDKADRLRDEFCEKFGNVKWRFDDAELAELRSVLSSRVKDNIYLSRQDCLSAYIVAILNHHFSEPVQTVATVCNYRNLRAPFVAKDVAGNMVHPVTITIPSDVDMIGIAMAIRQALVQHREPDFLHSLMSVTSDNLLKLSNAGMGVCSNEGGVIPVFINSQTMRVVPALAYSLEAQIHDRIDWCSAHFGCPDGARIYKHGTLLHSLRCFRSSPTKGGDGVWRARQSVDISLVVKAELRPKLLETLARGIRYILDHEDINLKP